MLRCIEQKNCNISYMHPNQNMKFNDWCEKIDPPMWIAAKSDCMNLPLKSLKDNDSMEKLFVIKPVAIGHFSVKNPVYDPLDLENG